MSTLRIIFRGLLGFVDTVTDGKPSLAVLLRNVRRPTPSADLSILSAHFSFLRVKSKYLGETRRYPERVLSQYSDRDADYLFFVRNEQIVFDTGMAPRGVVKFRDDTITMEKPDPSLDPAAYARQKKDCRWIVSMERAFPGSGQVDRDCLGANAATLVATRVLLSDGTLSVHKLGGERVVDGRPDASLYTFIGSDAADEFRQALSEEVVLEAPCSDIVQISSSLLRGAGTPPPVLVLKSVDGIIELFVQNSELEEVAGPPGAVVDTRNPVDFELLYELSLRRPPLRERRTPVGEGSAGERICPAASFTT